MGSPNSFSASSESSTRFPPKRLVECWENNNSIYVFVKHVFSSFRKHLKSIMRNYETTIIIVRPSDENLEPDRKHHFINNRCWYLAQKKPNTTSQNSNTTFRQCRINCSFNFQFLRVLSPDRRRPQSPMGSPTSAVLLSELEKLPCRAGGEPSTWFPPKRPVEWRMNWFVYQSRLKEQMPQLPQHSRKVWNYFEQIYAKTITFQAAEWKSMPVTNHASIVNFCRYSFVEAWMYKQNLVQTFGHCIITFSFKFWFPMVQSMDRRRPQQPMGYPNSFCLAERRWTLNLVPARKTRRIEE